MKQYCHYHPISLAIWHCDHCNIGLDKLCMPDGDDKLKRASCPHCKKPLRYLDKRSETAPFWQRKGDFVKKLLQAEAILVAVIIALVSLGATLSNFISIVCLIGSSVLAINTSIVFAKTLENSPNDPLRLGTLLQLGDFKQLGLISLSLASLIALPIIAFKFVGFSLAFLLVVLLSLPIPAILISLLYTPPKLSRRTFVRPSWFKVIQKMSLSYLTLSAYFAISYTLAICLADLLIRFLPSYIAFPITTLIAVFLLWFNMSALGYVLRRYENFNELSANPLSKQDAENTHSVGGRFEADLDIALKTGDYEKAMSLIEVSLKKSPRSDLRRQQLYKLASEYNDIEKLTQYAERIIELLLGQGQPIQAYELFNQVIQTKPDFLLNDIDVINDLSETLNEMKEYDLVVNLAQSCQQRFSTSKALSQVYLRAAKVLLSKLRRSKDAMFFLDWIIRHEEDQALAFAAQRLMEHIKTTR